MKPVIIIAIAVVCSVVAVGAVQFSVEPIKEIVNENAMIRSLTFNCAETYDKNYEIASVPNYDSQSSMEGLFELMDHRCFITVKSWAHESRYHNEISQTFWEDMSWRNQAYLDEIECQDQQCKDWIEDMVQIKEMFAVSNELSDPLFAKIFS